MGLPATKHNRVYSTAVGTPLFSFPFHTSQWSTGGSPLRTRVYHECIYTHATPGIRGQSRLALKKKGETTTCPPTVKLPCSPIKIRNVSMHASFRRNAHGPSMFFNPSIYLWLQSPTPTTHHRCILMQLSVNGKKQHF